MFHAKLQRNVMVTSSGGLGLCKDYVYSIQMHAQYFILVYGLLSSSVNKWL